MVSLLSCAERVEKLNPLGPLLICDLDVDSCAGQVLVAHQHLGGAQVDAGAHQAVLAMGYPICGV